MRRLELGRPVLLGNMLIVPVLGDDGCIETITLEEGLSKGASLRETGSIERVIVENSTEELLFVMDGEELIGERQDRMALFSTVVEKGEEFELPVVCIEKNRWEGDTPFSTGFTAFPRLRKTLTFEGKAIQEKVWSLIETKLKTLRVSSKTMSMHHSFVERERDLEIYQGWEPEEEAVGVMAFSNRGFLCCDIFNTRSLFRGLKDKLIKGYALDALEDRMRGRSYSLDLKKINRIWKQIESAETVQLKEMKHGRHEIVSAETVKGKRYSFEDDTIHATFFPAK